MKRNIKKVVILFIFIIFITGNFTNAIIADEENNKDKLYEKISKIEAYKETRDEKLEQSVENLLRNYIGRELEYFEKSLIRDFDFVDDKVRLEIILSNEDELGSLAFDENIEIEASVENLVQVLVPVNLIEDLSQQEFVNFIRKPVECIPHITSEGVGVIDADLVHATGYYGEGIKVAVIDVGFEDYDINPEIPPGRIVEAISYRVGYDIEYGGPHGSACTELVLDVAPLADLYLYSCGYISEFDNAVNQALSQNVDVISFSCGWTGINDYDGLGTVCNIVNIARSSGILFVVAAGNEANHHYEGVYNNLPLPEIDCHDFGSGDIFLDLGYLSVGTPYDIVLSWNDWPYSGQDYDLYLVDSGGYTVDCSINLQTGSQSPVERMSGVIYGDYFFIVIVRYAATWDVHLELYGHYNDFEEYNHPESSLSCPADATGATTVGATSWQNDNLEAFSSRGPTNNGQTKPDVTAPDGVSTHVYATFFGTSASAPHTAGAAALLLSVDPSLTANELQNKMESTALDLGDIGKDNLYGSGRINVWAAFNTINKPPVANDDYYSGTEDIILNVATPGVLANDTDLDNDPLTAILVSDVSNGALTLQSDGSFVYISDLNYYGTDSFTYKANDGTVDSNVATVTITVTPENDAPVAHDDYYSIAEDNVLTVSAPGILVNDTDIENDPLTAILMDGPTDGQLMAFAGDGSFTYIPNKNFSENDSFTYKANDNYADSNVATVHITVNPVNDPPVANFTYTPLISIPFEMIQFTNTSIDSDGTIASWQWDFGDGNTSFEQNPTYNYSDGGTYVVTLNVTDNDGLFDEISKEIIVNTLPLAGFSYDPINPFTNEHISFTDESIDPHGPITSWLWDFGDGNSSTEQNITHQYADNGTYTVTLNVTDEYGAANEISQQIIVSNVGPIANFTHYPLFPTDLQIINFTDTSFDSDGVIINWTWDFGDGNYSTEQNITHQYADNGTYTVTLNITDDDGATNETYVELMVANVPPVVNFTYISSIPTIDDIVQFNDTSIDLDGIIVNWSWDFGDGISYEQNTTHIYTMFGSYNVTLIVEDNDRDNSSISKQIITKIIYINMTQDGNETTINLQNETDMIIVINTTNSTTVNVSKYSGNPTGEDISGNITSIGKYIDVEVENESAVNWPVNITIYYTQNDLNNSNITESQLLGIYFWNNTIDEWHLYNDTGVNTTYNQSGYEGYCWTNAWHLTPLAPGGDNVPPSKVTGLTVTDAKDGKLSLSWDEATDNVAVDYYNIYHNGPAPSPIVVDHPTTTYTHTGLTNGQKYTYNVSAVDTSGNEGEKSDSKDGTPSATGGSPGGGDPPYVPPPLASNQPPIANASAGEPYGNVSEEITFNGSESYDPDGNITSWYWDFGDGTNGTGEVTTHTYSNPGVYNVTLTVTDNEDAEDTYETTAFITQANRDPSTPEITGPTKGSKNIVYDFSATSVDLDNNSIEYTFDWDDGNTSISDFLPNGTMYTATHSWTLAGKYTITVIAYDNKTYSGTAQLTVLIDVHYVGDIGYLIDDDSDGIYDSFYSNATGNETSVEQDNGIYLIDSDGDGIWDYEYNSETNALTPEEGIDRAVLVLVLAVVLVVAVIVIAFICFRCYVRKQGKK